MTQPQTNCQKVGLFFLRAAGPVSLQEIMLGTHLTKNQAAGALHYLVAEDIVTGLGVAGKARKFIVRDRPALEVKVDNPHRHGGGAVAAPRLDFGPLIEAMGQP